MADGKGHKKSDNNRSHSKIFKWLKRIIATCIVMLLCGVVAAGGLYLYLRTQPLPPASIPQTSQIVDYYGEVIDTFHFGENRHVVTLAQISPHLINATLAIEDHRFYSHFGIDLYGMARAAWIDIKERSMSQGASSISQQLARNLYLTHEKTWSRKIKEAMLALQLEMAYSKRDILTQYLNQIYFGHATYGVQAAAQLFFDKDAKDLTLAESALLAGVPKGPKYYSPYMNEANALARQQIVLQAMVKHGYITQEEADEAKEEQLAIQPLQKKQPSRAPYFTDFIRQQAMALLGLDEEVFNEGGFIIYTSLDMRMQRIAEQVITERLPEEEPDLQVALIAIDPRNGFVKAMIGGRDYRRNQYNRVFATSRQPGSAFKPIVYLTALEQGGFSAVTQFKSEPTVFSYDEGRVTYAPRNYGNRYLHDYIDLRKAIATSDNVYAVHTIMEIGADKVIAMAERLGVNNGQMRPLPSLALGTFPVSPFELASAFATLANQGVRQEPVAILQITDARGKVLYEHESAPELVIDPAYAFVLTNMLESIFEPGGTGHRVASLLKRPVAAKTGTTNTDAWMAGYTPELATAVWVGHDRDRSLSAMEALLAAPIFAQFTELALEPIPPKLFPVPDGIVSVYIDPVSGHVATPDCPEKRLEHFVRGSEPSQFCTLHEPDMDMDMELEWLDPAGLDPTGLDPAWFDPEGRGPAGFDRGEFGPSELKHDFQHDSWWSQLKRWWYE